MLLKINRCNIFLEYFLKINFLVGLLHSLYIVLQSVETDGVTALFQRSLEKYNLLYKIFLGDGGSKSYVVVSSAQTYGSNIFLAKEERPSR